MVKVNGYYKYVFNILLGVIFVGAVLSALLYFWILIYQKNDIYEKSKINANYELTKSEEYLNDETKVFKNTLDVLANQKSFKNYVSKKTSNIDNFEDFMKIIIDNDKNIFQLRFIDELGNEIIRFDKNNLNEVSKATNLQNKFSRYYFSKN